MSLLESTLFGTIDKVEKAIKRIQAFEEEAIKKSPEDGYFVAFSGGKDSVVIYDLVKRSGVRHIAGYSVTGIDPPELFRMVRDEYPEVNRILSEKTMWKLIEEKKMPPTRISRYCCKPLKETHGIGHYIITGVRWQESNKRRLRKMNELCFAHTGTSYLHPIIDWTSDEVWEYIRKYNVKYCKLYDEGFKRLGCIGCPMGRRKNQEEQFRRWPKYERLYKMAFEKICQGGEKNKWHDSETMFRWWLDDQDGNKDDDSQTTMFEEEEL